MSKHESAKKTKVSQTPVIVWESTSKSKQEEQTATSKIIPFRKKEGSSTSETARREVIQHEGTITEWSIHSQSEEAVKIKIISSGFGQKYQNGKVYCFAA